MLGAVKTSLKHRLETATQTEEREREAAAPRAARASLPHSSTAFLGGSSLCGAGCDSSTGLKALQGPGALLCLSWALLPSTARRDRNPRNSWDLHTSLGAQVSVPTPGRAHREAAAPAWLCQLSSDLPGEMCMFCACPGLLPLSGSPSVCPCPSPTAQTTQGCF